MIRDVDLVSYLPPYLVGYEENHATLEAENPEFILVWNAADRVLYNEFIETANEYGISRFEKILNILPSTEDTLEIRRARVQSLWCNNIPYTVKVIVRKLIDICGVDGCTIMLNENNYTLNVKISLENKNNYNTVQEMLDITIPANLIVTLEIVYNQHSTISKYTHNQLALFSHDNIRNEVLHI